MADQSKIGTDWSAEELDAIVADYFAMLALDASQEPFVKAHRARALMEATGRTHRSVEFKHMNISAVASELGLPTVRGYKPKANYQAAIFPGRGPVPVRPPRCVGHRRGGFSVRREGMGRRCEAVRRYACRANPHFASRAGSAYRVYELRALVAD